jgi:hypothetical protein
MSNHHLAAPPAAYTHSLRVEISIDGSRVSILKVHHVAMRAPAPSAAPTSDKHTGYWVQLHDANGKVLYHRSLRTPHVDSVEVYADEEHGAIRRSPSPPRVFKMDLILPDLEGAEHLVLFGAHDMKQAARPSTEVLRAALTDLKRRAANPDGDDDNDADRR